MKKVLFTLFVAIAATLSASAQKVSDSAVFAKNPDQVVPGLKYSQLKKLYDQKDAAYLADPTYGTRRAWFNLLVPGVAQYTMGEGGLGTRYLLLGLLGESMLSLAAYDSYMDDIDPQYQSIFSTNSGDYYWIPVFGGAAILIADYICSISNAKKVARVKSLYEHDLNTLNRRVSFQAVPFIAPVRVGGNVQPAAGITFAMQF